MVHDALDWLADAMRSTGLGDGTAGSVIAALAILATVLFILGALAVASRPSRQAGSFTAGLLFGGLALAALLGVFVLLLDPRAAPATRLAAAAADAPFATPDPTLRAQAGIVELRPDIVAAQAGAAGAAGMTQIDYIARSREAIDAARAANDVKAEAWALLDLGEAELALGHVTQASETLETALVQFAMIEDYPGTIRALVQLGLVRQAYGEHEKARALFADARRLDVSLGEPVGVAAELEAQGLLD